MNSTTDGNSIPRRLLGRTGVEVPILGLGTAPGGMGLEDRPAIALYERALELGVNYIDTAPGYGRAQKQLGEMIPGCRDELFLATKVPVSTAAEALERLEQNMRDLRTNRVDLTYVHSLGRRDVDQMLAPDGVFEGLREARRRGWTRFIGCTAHNAAWKMRRVIAETDVDVVMAALNYADRHTYDFEGEVLPVARSRGVGVAAMKVFGGAPGMNYEKPTPSKLELHGGHSLEAALRYALDLPGVAIAVVGAFSEEELEQNVEWARRWQPLSDDEQEALIEGGKEIAAAWGTHFGEVE